ncbi:hypothetical protein XPA_003450 [Xanthoria parietina]
MVTTRSHKRPRQTSSNSARSVHLPEEDEAPKDDHMVFDVRRDHACHAEKSIPPESTSQSSSSITQTLRKHLLEKLQSRQFPKTICPSEIPRALPRSDLTLMGLTDWRDLMPRVRTILFDMRSEGQVEILQKGKRDSFFIDDS